MKAVATACVMTVCLLAAGCDPAENVRVQPLPPLEGASPEARAGLPEIAGQWRFAGWELAEGDSAALAGPLPGFGELRLETQRLDSVAGFYLFPGGRLPVVGEVRRDSIVALVAGLGEGEGRYLAGRVSRDTLWVSLTTLLEPGTWPTGAQAAFVRSPVSATFARLQGEVPVPVQDTLPPVLAGEIGEGLPPREGAPPAERPVATGTTGAAGTGADERAAPPASVPTEPRQQQPRTEPVAPPPTEREPVTPPPREPVATPPTDTPRAAPRDTVRRRPPVLLGEPIRQDTLRS